MRKTLAVVTMIAGLSGLLGAGTELSSSDPRIMIGAFLGICAILSIALGAVEWNNRHRPPFRYLPLLLTAGVAGFVAGMSLIVLAFD